MHKLILIEGINGIGKTTFTHDLSDELQRQHYHVVLHYEGVANPINLSRTAVFFGRDYDNILSALSDAYGKKEKEHILSKLNQLSYKEGRYILVPFEPLLYDTGYAPIIEILKQHEVFNGKVDFSLYRELYHKRWSTFTQNNKDFDTIHVFDGALLQTTLFDLMGFYCMSNKEILSYIQEILDCVKSLNPLIIYLDTDDVKNVVDRVCLSRSDVQWEKGFKMWLKYAPYCIKRSYRGRSGMISYLVDRKEVEHYILRNINTPSKILWRKVQ